MNAVNITEVHLLNAPLENDYLHTLWFSDQAAQYAYFYSKIVSSYTDFSYQRKDQIIRVPHQYDKVIGCNYVMYKNSLYSNKWFYAFITDIKYVDAGRTDISIETDVIQTWLFDYTVLPSFVEREHCDNDTIGNHTIPENLEMGEYTINAVQSESKLKPSNYIVMGSTVLPSGEDNFDVDVGAVYNGVYSGSKYYAYPKNSIASVIQSMADGNASDAITSLFMAPAYLINNTGGIVEQSESANQFSMTVPKNYDLHGYTPKNNKLYCYPYNVLLLSNGNGGTAEYRYEWFNTETCEFRIWGALTPGCSIRAVPNSYKGASNPNIDGLNLGKYPQCNWATDQYTNWLTQNGVNHVTSIIGGIGTAAVGFSVAQPTMAIAGISGVINSLTSIHNASLVPPQFEGNVNCGDVITSMGENTFTAYALSIRYEYAKTIDHFFTCYGYKCHLVKTPNSNHRKNFWYTQTKNVNIDGAIPMKDLRKIKNCYDNGITFWKNPANIGKYNDPEDSSYNAIV